MRHRFHSICPYFAMFPETFVEKHLAASRFNGVVFDPFCGRGTTVFEALLNGREAAGCDLHPVAVCITGAKCNPPTREDVVLRLGEDPKSIQAPDDGRHYNKVLYWAFLKEAWEGVAPLLAPQARIVVRIGGRKLSKEEMFDSLLSTLKGATGRHVQAVDGGVTTPVKRTQANSFRGAKASPTVEHDFCFIVG